MLIFYGSAGSEINMKGFSKHERYNTNEKLTFNYDLVNLYIMSNIATIKEIKEEV